MMKRQRKDLAAAFYFLYGQGLSLREVGEETGYSYAYISRTLREAGWPTRPAGRPTNETEEAPMSADDDQRTPSSILLAVNELRAQAVWVISRPEVQEQERTPDEYYDIEDALEALAKVVGTTRADLENEAREFMFGVGRWSKRSA